MRKAAALSGESQRYRGAAYAGLSPTKASQLVSVKIGAGNCGGFAQVLFFDTLVTPEW
jgi:hypothetical protein